MSPPGTSGQSSDAIFEQVVQFVFGQNLANEFVRHGISHRLVEAREALDVEAFARIEIALPGQKWMSDHFSFPSSMSNS